MFSVLVEVNWLESFNQHKTMSDSWQAFGKIDSPASRVVTPYRLPRASTYCSAQLADSIFGLLSRPCVCFLYSAACRAILTFLRNQDCSAPLQDKEVNNLTLKSSVDYLGTAEYKLFYKRQ